MIMPAIGSTRRRTAANMPTRASGWLDIAGTRATPARRGRFARPPLRTRQWRQSHPGEGPRAVLLLPSAGKESCQFTRSAVSVSLAGLHAAIKSPPACERCVHEIVKPDRQRPDVFLWRRVELVPLPRYASIIRPTPFGRVLMQRSARYPGSRLSQRYVRKCSRSRLRSEKTAVVKVVAQR